VSGRGIRIPVSYGRLREACQTDVDGTSIDTMEEVAMQLGLEAEQIMVPADFVMLPEANLLPAIAVVLRASKLTHFVVAWRSYGALLQVMDPAVGRQWEGKAQFASSLYIHTLAFRAGLEGMGRVGEIHAAGATATGRFGNFGEGCRAFCRIRSGRSWLACAGASGGRHAKRGRNCAIRGLRGEGKPSGCWSV